jgi:hypothetical protein
VYRSTSLRCRLDDRPAALFPGPTVLQLLFGYRPLAELE